uniref:MAT1-1-10 protein n=1 Tax=Morchella rufobrunnea TaxID=368404 RepID=A0A7T7FRJ2_9PEZI|nr:MAT1-1-10 protein [Morchella rufobrunnea]
MPQTYLSYKDHFILNNERREAVLRLGRILIQTKNELAFFPRTPYNSKIRRVMIFCTETLKEFKIKNLHPALLDRRKDIYPLTHLYNLGVQILALREVNIRLERDIKRWNCRLKALQDSFPENSSDVGLVLAEVHEFLVFATIANQVHTSHTLTYYSIRLAAEAAKGSIFTTEATHTISILRAAFAVQNEIQIQRTLMRRNYIISDPVSLPQIVLTLCSDWYNHRKDHASRIFNDFHQNDKSTQIPFENLMTWFCNGRRRIITCGQTINFDLKAIIDGAVSSKIPSKIETRGDDTDGDNGDGEPEWEIPLSRMIAEFLDELGDAPHELDSPSHPITNISSRDIPLVFPVNNSMDKFAQGCQYLLKSIYNLFNEVSSACLDILQRAHWLDAKNKQYHTSKAKIDMDRSCLRAINVLLATKKPNKTYLECQNHPWSDLLEKIFEVFPDPNTAEEEYMSYATGMNINQIHTSCKGSINLNSVNCLYFNIYVI